MKDIQIYAEGIFALSACVPNLSANGEIEAAVNELRPTGTSSAWRISKSAFADGTPNPCPCNDDIRRKHVLLNC